MKSIGPFFYTAVAGLAFSFAVGYAGAHTLAAGAAAMFLTAVLAILETSLSFDNALVNANVLSRMSPEWQRRFLTWGMLTAVFGMRLLFPVLVVSCVAKVAPWHALNLAFADPAAYAKLIQSAHVPLSGFGGAFLTMVALGFFIDPEKAKHWFTFIEKPLARLGKIKGIKVALGVVAVSAISYFAPVADQSVLFISGLLGIASHWIVGAVGSLSESAGQVVDGVKRSGAAQFAYLELVDASFSFDGVIGAFALTNNLMLIATGLGIGALAVRSMTVQLARAHALTKFKFIEHGTYYAIAALGTFLLAGTSLAIPSVVTGCAGAVLIGAAAIHSIFADRQLRQSLLSNVKGVYAGALRLGFAGVLLAVSHGAWDVLRGRTFVRPAATATESRSASGGGEAVGAKVTRGASQEDVAAGDVSGVGVGSKSDSVSGVKAPELNSNQSENARSSGASPKGSEVVSSETSDHSARETSPARETFGENLRPVVFEQGDSRAGLNLNSKTNADVTAVSAAEVNSEDVSAENSAMASRAITSLRAAVERVRASARDRKAGSAADLKMVADLKVVADADGLMSALDKRQSVMDGLAKVTADQLDSGQARTDMNNWARSRLADWSSEAAGLDKQVSEAVKGLADVLAEHPWGDVLEATSAGCVEDLTSASRSSDTPKI